MKVIWNRTLENFDALAHHSSSGYYAVRGHHHCSTGYYMANNIAQHSRQLAIWHENEVAGVGVGMQQSRDEQLLKWRLHSNANLRIMKRKRGDVGGECPRQPTAPDKGKTNSVNTNNCSSRLHSNDDLSIPMPIYDMAWEWMEVTYSRHW